MPNSLRLIAIAIFFIVVGSTYVHSEDLSHQIAKILETATLDQTGTAPFHLKATFAPSLEHDKDSHRTGEIEIWWQSPSLWRRELHAQGFQQITILDGTRQWQKNQGDYLPNWLRELSQALIQPVPIPVSTLVERVKTGSGHMRFPTRTNGEAAFTEQINIDWGLIDGPGDPQINGKGYIALLKGELSYTGGLGWSGDYKDFKDFHSRKIGRTVSSGSPEVTAHIDLLEDMGSVPASLFDTQC